MNFIFSLNFSHKHQPKRLFNAITCIFSVKSNEGALTTESRSFQLKTITVLQKIQVLQQTH